MNMKVLVVQDYVPWYNRIENYLVELGASTITNKRSSNQAILELRKMKEGIVKYDLLILDTRFPKNDTESPIEDGAWKRILDEIKRLNLKIKVIVYANVELEKVDAYNCPKVVEILPLEHEKDQFEEFKSAVELCGIKKIW